MSLRNPELTQKTPVPGLHRHTCGSWRNRNDKDSILDWYDTFLMKSHEMTLLYLTTHPGSPHFMVRGWMLVVALGISMDPRTNLQETRFFYFLFTIKHGASPEAFERILGIRMLGKAYYLTKLKKATWGMVYDDSPMALWWSSRLVPSENGWSLRSHIPPLRRTTLYEHQ